MRIIRAYKLQLTYRNHSKWTPYHSPFTNEDFTLSNKIRFQFSSTKKHFSEICFYLIDGVNLLISFFVFQLIDIKCKFALNVDIFYRSQIPDLSSLCSGIRLQQWRCRKFINVLHTTVHTREIQNKSISRRRLIVAVVEEERFHFWIVIYICCAWQHPTEYEILLIQEAQHAAHSTENLTTLYLIEWQNQNKFSFRSENHFSFRKYCFSWMRFVAAQANKRILYTCSYSNSKFPSV